MKILIKLGLIFCLHTLSAEPRTAHGKEAQRVVYKFVDTAIKNKNVRFLGYSGAMFSDIETLDLHFESRSLNNIDDARIEIVKLTEEFLDIVNNDNNVKTYLKNYLFTPQNLRISIEYINNADLDECVTFAQVVMLYGKIFYYPNSGMKYLKKETYEEAKEIVNSQINRISALES